MKKVLGLDLGTTTLGSMPLEGAEKNAVKLNTLRILKDKYGIEEEDLVSAELEIVPAGPARDYGLDRSMVAALAPR